MQREDLPFTLTVKDIAGLLSIGRSKAYEIIRMPNFPVVRLGSRIIIPRDLFFKWLNDYAGSNTQNSTV